MADMLVKLFCFEPDRALYQSLEEQGISLRRAMTPDKSRIVRWVDEHFGPGWASECDVAFSRRPVTAFVAVQEGRLLGFACYETTCRNFFGPTGVQEGARGLGIGKALLHKCLEGLREMGYAYCVIGDPGPIAFYEKCCGATMIPDEGKTIYKDLLDA